MANFWVLGAVEFCGGITNYKITYKSSTSRVSHPSITSDGSYTIYVYILLIKRKLWIVRYETYRRLQLLTLYYNQSLLALSYWLINSRSLIWIICVRIRGLKHALPRTGFQPCLWSSFFYGDKSFHTYCKVNINNIYALANRRCNMVPSWLGVRLQLVCSQDSN